MSVKNHVDAGFGERLRETRRARGLSQRALAFPGCSGVYVCRIERGHRTPSLQVVRELAVRLGVGMDWLATGAGEPTTGRYVTALGGLLQLPSTAGPTVTTDDDDMPGRFRVYRLVRCVHCNGLGRLYAGTTVRDGTRCDECRGEGRVLERVASAEDEGGVGQAIVTLGREGEFDGTPIGVLDKEGETGKKWLVTPWQPSPRNVSDAGRVLGAARKGER